MRIVRAGRSLASGAVWLGSVVAASLPVSISCMAEDLSVFSSGAAAVAQQSFAAALKPGPKIKFTVAMPAVLEGKLKAGEHADVIVAPAQALDALERASKLLPDSRITVARVGIGMAVRAGSAHPDITNVPALRATLLASPSIVQPDPTQAGSVAGKAIARILTDMGIAEVLRPRVVYRQAIAGGVEMVARGEAALGLFNVSEILPVEGVSLAGRLPPEVQSYIAFDAAVIAGSAAEGPARAYVRSLTGNLARAHWEAAGLEAAPAAK